MIQTVITILVVVVALALLARYIWLEFSNPCRNCNKECDKRGKR